MEAPWLVTNSTPDGREEELPQLSKNRLNPSNETKAINPRIFFNISSPSRFPFTGISQLVIAEIEAPG